MSSTFPARSTYERLVELNKIAHYYRAEVGLTGRKLQDAVSTLALQRGLCLPSAMLSFVTDFVDKHARVSGRTSGERVSAVEIPTASESQPCVADAAGAR